MKARLQRIGITLIVSVIWGYFQDLRQGQVASFFGRLVFVVLFVEMLTFIRKRFIRSKDANDCQECKKQLKIGDLVELDAPILPALRKTEKTLCLIDTLDTPAQNLMDNVGLTVHHRRIRVRLLDRSLIQEYRLAFAVFAIHQLHPFVPDTEEKKAYLASIMLK